MSLFAAWTGVVLAAARMEPAPSDPCRLSPPAPEPRRIRLSHNPMLAPAPVPAAMPVRRAGQPPVPAEPVLEVSLRTPLLLGK